jgi:predicted Zn-ribbon and HTH transcriptional regulator
MDANVTKPSETGEKTANVDLNKYVPKEDYERLSGSVKDLEAKLDEAKLSLLDPDYITFLEGKKGQQANVVAHKAINTLTAEDVEGLTSKQILDLAVERAKEAVISELLPRYEEKLRKQDATMADVLAVLELQDVKERHQDFESFRDATRKILETSKTPLTIEQAYKQAKYEAFERGELKSEPEKPPKAPPTEKPTGTVPGDTLTTKTFKGKDDASEAAWNEVVGPGKDTL